MQDYKIGQRIKNVNPDTTGTRANKGALGYITDIDDETVYVKYDNGNTGNSDNPARYYQIIDGSCRTNGTCANGSNAPKTTMFKSITTFVKNLALSADEKLLREVGLKDECGQYSDTAENLVITYLTGQNEAVLIEWAKAYKAKQKEDKE